MARRSKRADAGGEAKDGLMANWPATTVSLWPIDKIIPYDKNPRTHPQAQLDLLAKSMQEDGVTMPILCDEVGIIIAGHGRRLAALQNGFTEYPVVVARGWSEEKKRVARLKDNSIGLLSGWDVELIKGEIRDLKTQGYDVMELGFPELQLRSLGVSIGMIGDPNVAQDEAPEPPKNPVSRTGDLWLLGNHRLLCGDSFDPVDLDRLLGNNLVDAFMTDPPYAIYGSSTGIAADISDDKMVRPFFEKLGMIIAGRMKEFGHAYICCDWRSFATVWHGMKFAGLVPKNCIVWDKGGAGLGSNYANTHEFIAYFVRLPPSKAMTSGNRSGQRIVNASNIIRENRVTGDERQHNAAKPVAMLERIIGYATDAEEVVADLFAGSGSTIIACERSKRRAMALEMEGKFVDVCVQRWQAFTKGQAILDGTKHTFDDVRLQRSIESGSKKKRAAPAALPAQK